MTNELNTPWHIVIYHSHTGIIDSHGHSIINITDDNLAVARAIVESVNETHRFNGINKLLDGLNL